MKLSDCQIPGAELIRDAEFATLGFMNFDSDGLLTFAESETYVGSALRKPNVAVLMTTPELARRVPAPFGVVATAEPRRALFELHIWLARATAFYGAETTTVVSPKARVNPQAWIDPVGVEIGEDAYVEARAVIKRGSVIGRGCVIRAGTIVSGEGFEMKRWDGRVVAVPHAGGVRLGREVELQQGCVVDRSVFGGYTEIGEETKCDNLVHIAHNCRIGARCLIAAGAIIAGSAMVGDDVWIGPGAIVSNGVTIGSRAHVALGSVIVKDVGAGCRVLGRAIGHLVEADRRLEKPESKS